MRIAVSEYISGNTVSVDWIHILPYAASGTFKSQVFGNDRKTAWGTVAITSDIPAGTNLTTEVRTGNTPT